MCNRNEKKDSILKIVAITSTVVLAVIAIGAVLYKLFTKYCKITFECDGNCDDCLDTDCCCDEMDEGACCEGIETEDCCDCCDEIEVEAEPCCCDESETEEA